MKPHEPNPEAKLRKCLTCTKDFMSEWSGNRMCPTCKRRIPNNPVHNRYVNDTHSETGRQISKKGMGQ